MICSWCHKDKGTVDRNMFDGLCADCTDLALNNEHIAQKAKENNEKLKQGMEPKYECPCESTEALARCSAEGREPNCDGVYIWE